MDITLHNKGPHKIITIEGLLNKDNVKNLSDVLFTLIHENTPSIVFDLTRLNYMDSSGLGVFIAAKKEMDGRKGRFSLINPNKNILFLLEIVSLDDFFTIYTSDEELPAII
jgi:anti-sigma B factor antagonist